MASSIVPDVTTVAFSPLWYVYSNSCIFVSFFSFISYAIFLNVAMLSGWRHFYFLHLFIIYFSTLGMSVSYKFLKKYVNLNLLVITSLLFIASLSYTNYKFHPFQSLYFVNFLNHESVNDLNALLSDANSFIISISVLA